MKTKNEIDLFLKKIDIWTSKVKERSAFCSLLNQPKTSFFKKLWKFQYTKACIIMRIEQKWRHIKTITGRIIDTKTTGHTTKISRTSSPS